ncbi:hypothetical protein [Microcoleus sp. AT3-D2]|uniref:hypothetical protein n=1 Tax=Microcoleus sp. AT3-D2 TaxID=2818612 RepID=UPI002FCFB741
MPESQGARSLSFKNPNLNAYQLITSLKKWYYPVWRGGAIAKKNPAKIGRELINQGASTNLVSGLTAPLSGHFGRILENFWRGGAIAKKNPAKIGRELINQGASTN